MGHSLPTSAQLTGPRRHPGTAGKKKRAVGRALQPCAAAWEQVQDREMDFTSIMVLLDTGVRALGG